MRSMEDREEFIKLRGEGLSLAAIAVHLQFLIGSARSLFMPETESPREQLETRLNLQGVA